MDLEEEANIDQDLDLDPDVLISPKTDNVDPPEEKAVIKEAKTETKPSPKEKPKGRVVTKEPPKSKPPAKYDKKPAYSSARSPTQISFNSWKRKPPLPPPPPPPANVVVEEEDELDFQPIKHQKKKIPAGNIALPGHSRAFKSLVKMTNRGELINQMLHVKGVVVKTSSSSSSESEANFKHVLEAIYTLDDHEYVFMQRLLDYEDVEAAGVTFRQANPVDLAYQLMDHKGKLLLLMEQHRIRCTSFIIFTNKAFENTIYDLAGNKVLKFIGPSMFLSKIMSKMEITDAHGRLLGYVKAFGSRVNYSVYSATGERLYLVTSDNCIPSNKSKFKILANGKPIGGIKNRWHLEFPEWDFIDAQDAGIHFPLDMDNREKVLLIGCMMLIEFSWYSPLTKLKLFFVFASLFLTILALVLAFIPMLFDKLINNPDTQSFYTSDGATLIELDI